MNTLHFKYAVEIAKTGSITQAADNLFMAQPNLSKAVKELEDTLGITIFERSSKGVMPTKKGMEFLGYARNILSQIQEMETLCEEDKGDSCSFNISIPRGSYISQSISDFVSELDMSNGPNINIDIKETNSVDTINSVADGLFNLGIIRCQTINEKYFQDYLSEKHLCNDMVWEFEHLVLMSAKHPLASAPSVSHEDLHTYTEIVHGDNIIPYLQGIDPGMKSSAARQASGKIAVYERGSQFEIMTRVPTTYMWGAPLSASMEALYGLVQRKCVAEDNKYKDLLIYRKGYEITDLDKHFLEKLYASKNEVAYREYR